LEIEISNLTKYFGSTLAVDNVSAHFSGKINLLLGPNGSGKSTLINLLAGLSYPNSGTLKIDGHEYDGKNRRLWRKVTEEQRKKSTFWLDKPGLPQTLTGKELLKFERGDYHARNSALTPSFEDVLRSSFGSSSLDLDKPISSYSSGMQQKLGIIASLIGDPEFVVWDEPTAALDATSRKIVAKLAKDYAVKGTKFLIASHIPGDFEGVVDWVALMQLGKLVKSGKLSDISAEEWEKDYVITTEKSPQLAEKLLELGWVESVSVAKMNSNGTRRVSIRANDNFDEGKVAILAREELGSSQFSLEKKQKTITDLYLEVLK
jgi:ABC-2 type transport system ATP-binding protein